MHLSLILCAVAIACGVRLLFTDPGFEMGVGANESKQWRHVLGVFLFPPLLLLVMAVAVLHMGKQGQMLGLPVGEIGFSCAFSFLGLAAGCLLWRFGQAWYSVQKVRQHSIIEVQNAKGYLLETNLPFAAQIGFWRSHLVISQGLLMHLSTQHVTAVLTHEQAHAHYRDTFWFFWLGWLRQFSVWLPNTEPLWQKLLLLREIRADRWAAEQVDALLIAEALLQMTQFPCVNLENACAAVACAAVDREISLTRLEERIEALLASDLPPSKAAGFGIAESTVQALPWWLLLTLMPLSTVVLHHSTLAK